MALHKIAKVGKKDFHHQLHSDIFSDCIYTGYIDTIELSCGDESIGVWDSCYSLIKTGFLRRGSQLGILKSGF